jgi:hypothetical protein
MFCQSKSAGSLFSAIVLIAAINLNLPTDARANLVTNGDFETGDFTGWTAASFFIARSSTFGSFPAGGSSIASTINGVDDGAATLIQSLATQPGGLYTLTFDYNSGGNSRSFPAPYAELKIYWDGALVADLVDGAQQWNTSTLPNLGASSTSTTLEFAAYQNPGQDGLDNIDVELAAATPLPAALPLFASGLGGLGLLGWRRKGKARAIATQKSTSQSFLPPHATTPIFPGLN